MTPVRLLRGKVTEGCDRISSALPRGWRRVFNKARTITTPAVTLKMIAQKGKDAPILGTYLVARNVIFRFWLPIAMGAEVISPSTGFAIFGAGVVLDLAAVAAQEHGGRKNRSRSFGQTLRNLRGEHRTAALHQQYLNRLYMRRHRADKIKGTKQHRGSSKQALKR